MAANKFLEKVTQIVKRFRGPKQSLQEFSRDLKSLAINLESGLKYELASEMCALHEDIVDSTPVDTGLAQANWQISSTKNSEILHKDVLEAKASRYYWEKGLRIVDPAKTPSPEKFMSAKRLFIFNNLDYISDLEAGSSEQAAPGAMIADNVLRHQVALEAALKRTGVFK